MHDVAGNTLGLKPSQLAALRRTYRRRVDADQVISPELAQPPGTPAGQVAFLVTAHGACTFYGRARRRRRGRAARPGRGAARRGYRIGSFRPISTMASSASAFPLASSTGWWVWAVLRRCFQVANPSFTMPQ